MTVPFVKKYELDVTSLTTSMNINAIAAKMEFAGTVTGVEYIPNGTQAGGIDVNHRMLRLFNRLGGAGTGTTSLAVLDLTSANANGTLTDNVPSAFSLTTSTALLAFTSGDVLEYQSSMSATGVSDPGGRVIITVSRSVS